MKLKGITVGTYISKRPKGKFDESICASCVNNKNKNIDKEKQYELCKGCDKFYVSKTCKAVLTTGRDQTTGQTQRKSFVADTEQEALDKALNFRINLNKNGGPRIITKTNKTLMSQIPLRIPIERYKDFEIDAEGNWTAYYTNEYIINSIEKILVIPLNALIAKENYICCFKKSLVVFIIYI